MKVIYKYELDTTDINVVEMPKGGEILCVHTQNDIPYIWVLVDPNETQMNRIIETFGTGHPINENDKRRYIGTYQQYNGQLMFHCFELLEN